MRTVGIVKKDDTSIVDKAKAEASLEAVSLINDLPEGGTRSVVRKNGDRICLIRQSGRITAVQDVCTHQEFAMSAGDVLPDGSIQCAWHGAKFDCTTGEVRQVPATEPLPVYEVKVDGDRIFVGGIRPRLGKGYEPSVAEIGK